MRSTPAAWLLFVLASCGPPPRDLAWEVQLDEAGLRERVRVLEAEIRDGGCAGTALWSLTFDVDAPPANMGPPDLPPGSYGFAITARDPDCMRYAIGCAELELPQEEGSTVVVTLSAFPGGAACPSEVCADGVCGGFDAGVSDGGVMCPAARGDCNLDPSDGCETPLDTTQSCGSCGSVCRLDHATPACSAGACTVAACADGWADCNGAPEDGCETSVRTAIDCGSCGSVCDLPNASDSCETGSCALAGCHPGFGDCDGVASNGCEASLIDADNCGSCGSACSGLSPICGVVSGSRECVAACTLAETQCGTSCVDLSSEAQHCGSCGTVCRSDRAAGVCSASSCGLGACDPLFGDCNGVAADGCETPLVGATDCGSCGAACGSPTAVTSCATGVCQVDDCNPDLADCDASAANGCEADLRSATSCGSCEMTCGGSTPVCGPSDASRACLAECVEPLPDACGDRCFDTASDVENCGSCGRSCTLPNASVRCAEGECRVGSCEAGFGNCDGTSVNGCETTLLSSAEHCGACGRSCAGAANAAGACVAGECVVRCDDGFGDCDGDSANGCERALNTTTDCGGCGVSCAPANAAASCAAGTCRIESCNAGFANCDGNDGNGCESRTSSDPRNCGGCGVRCSGGMRNCCDGVCCA